jgi:hypothetical protein
MGNTITGFGLVSTQLTDGTHLCASRGVFGGRVGMEGKTMADDGATEWQAAAIAAGDLLIWTVCKSPSDYPGLFTARPHSTRANAPCDFVLTAESLQEIRDMLPPGVAPLLQWVGDDPVILETWV